MKKFMKVGVLVVASMLLTLTSCKKKDDAEPEKATTGGLVVKVKLEGSTGFLTEFTVGLATSEENLENGVYLKELDADKDGNANFGELNPGNYYYDCDVDVADESYYGEGQVQIIAGTDLTNTLIVTSQSK